MSNDLEDLVDYSLGLFIIPSTTNAQRTKYQITKWCVHPTACSMVLTEQESVSGKAEQETEPDLDDSTLPTDNELRLAQRVLELERERDALAVRILLRLLQ